MANTDSGAASNRKLKAMSQRPNCSASSQRQKSTARTKPTNRCTAVSPKRISTLSTSVSVGSRVGAAGYSGLSKETDIVGLGPLVFGLRCGTASVS